MEEVKEEIEPSNLSIPQAYETEHQKLESSTKVSNVRFEPKISQMDETEQARLEKERYCGLSCKPKESCNIF